MSLKSKEDSTIDELEIVSVVVLIGALIIALMAIFFF